MPDFEALRERMVERQLRRRGITDKRILDAFRQVPRELFVDAAFASQAYDDNPLPIEAGQTISQPYIVALMIDAACVGPRDRVLEVGAGSGYAAAVISRIAGRVTAIERHPKLAEVARERLDDLGYRNIEIVAGDGTLGWPAAAPYDAILVAASGSHVPPPLVEQLSPGGTLVMPVGAQSGVQQLIRVVKHPDGTVHQSRLGEVRFVPLVGREGWTSG